MKVLYQAMSRAALEPQWHLPTLPPSFLLPLRARLSTVPSSIVSRPPPEPLQSSRVNPKASKENLASSHPPSSAPSIPSQPHNEHPQSSTPPSSTLSPSILEMLPLLRSQPSHYITAHIHARPYLLTAGDTLRLPFHMPKVKPGDVLRLNRASSIGSRDYTMRGAPYLDERLFECRATVVGVEAEPMRYLEKTKRRNRKVKTVKSKHRFTLLKLKELKIMSPEGGYEEVAADGSTGGAGAEEATLAV
ncbi:hypothetical protein MMC30_003621 [Trapelia coarctata]|nr:hypothetical protein [Trapelia coarctata]